MKNCNPIKMESLTNQEIEVMQGCVVGDEFKLRGEICRVTSVSEGILVLHPLWDLDEPS